MKEQYMDFLIQLIAGGVILAMGCLIIGSSYEIIKWVKSRKIINLTNPINRFILILASVAFVVGAFASMIYIGSLFIK